jgi:hypothetical protein
MKSLQEVKSALDGGVSRITLELSEKLRPEAFEASMHWIDREFQKETDPGDAEVLLHLFAGREFRFQGGRGEFSIRFDEEKTKRNALLFHHAIDFCEEVYEFIRLRTGYRPVVDFEISLEKAPFPISSENHLFFTIALCHRGVRMDSFVPRFAGGFEEEGDFRVDPEAFRRQFYQHGLIAQDYGNYRISIFHVDVSGMPE